MSNCNTKDCEMCQAHNHYIYLLTEDIPSEKAFHTAVAKLTAKMIEEMSSVKIEECYENGYIDGFVEALEDTADNLYNAIDAIKSRLGHECTCEHEEVSLLEKCAAECDCVDECEINKAIGRSFNGE